MNPNRDPKVSNLVDLLTECEEVYRANGQRRHAACFRRARESVLDAVFPLPSERDPILGSSSLGHQSFGPVAERRAAWWDDDAGS